MTGGTGLGGQGDVARGGESLSTFWPDGSPDCEGPCPCDRWCPDHDGLSSDQKATEDEVAEADEGGAAAPLASGRGACTLERELDADLEEDGSPVKAVPFPSWVERFLSQILGAGTRFSYFLRSSIKCCREGRSKPIATALFPIPVPDVSIWGSLQRPSQERRIRRAEMKVLHLAVMALNYQYFRSPLSVLGLLRRRPSLHHQEVYSRLMALIRACGHSEMVSISGCGRKSFQLDARFRELWQFLSSQGLGDMGVYNKCFRGSPVPKDDTVREELRPYRDLNAQRLKISGEGHWRCDEFLPDLLYMPYVEPRINFVDFPLDENNIPDNSKNDFQEMLELCKVWDAKGLLRLLPAAYGPDPNLCVRVFNNFKSQTADRQIGDRRAANSQEGRIPGPSKWLPSAPSLLQLYAKRHREQLVGSITDRRDFYHQFSTTIEKASMNAIYPWPRLSDLGALNAVPEFLRTFAPGKKVKKKTREEEGDLLGIDRTALVIDDDPIVVPCFSALFQGDHLGVEVATASHQNLLQDAGLLRDGSRLQSSSFIWKDEIVDGLCIDDYFVVSREDVKEDDEEHAKSGSVRRLKVAKDVYIRERLLGSDDKDVLGRSTFKVIGGEVVSSPGSVARGVVAVGSPAQKRWGLAMLSAALACLPYTSDSLHASVVGAWISVLMYRRPMMAVMKEVFRVIPPSELDTENPKLWSLSRKAAEEFLILACLAPVLSSNLAVPFAEVVYASDASMAKGAFCSAFIGEELGKLLWRSSDMKGTNVPLMRSSEALLAYYDIDYEPTEEKPSCKEDDEEAGERGPQRPLGLYFEFVEVCGGAGTVTKQLILMGVVCGPVFDLSYSQQFDFSSIRVLRWIIFMIEEGRILSFLVSPPCTTFSPAAFPCLRSYQEPMGFDRSHPRVLLGNKLANHSMALMLVARRTRTPGLMEQPLRSKMRWLKQWRRLLRLGAKEVHLASCAFGSPHEKKFCFLGVHMQLEELRRPCTRDHVHVRIEGKFTKPSATYTRGLAIALARVFRDHLLDRARRMEMFDLDSRGLEDLVSNDLSASLSWTTGEAWKWKGFSHINILEASAISKVFENEARGGGDKRFCFLSDSHVARASVARGRTSSDAMQPVLRRIGCLSVAYGLYGVGRFTPTRINPADAPTRDYHCLEPCERSLLSEKSEDEVAWLLSRPRLRRWSANWARLTLLLLPGLVPFSLEGGRRVHSIYPLDGPDVSLDFDSCLGYPGEGPCFNLAFVVMLRHLVTTTLGLSLSIIQALLFVVSFGFLPVWISSFVSTSGQGHTLFPLRLLCVLAVFELPMCCSTGVRGSHGDSFRRQQRSGVLLPEGRRVTELTSANRQVFMSLFCKWLDEEGKDYDVVFAGMPDIDTINRWITDYGRKLFYEGKPYYHYSETINAIAAKRPTLRRSLMQAWDLAFMWNSLEPVEHHCALPHQVLLAVLSTCILWGWVREASVFALLFGALLRSGEVLAARRKDLIFPQDVGGTLDHILIRILEPKTRFRAARHQASRVEQPDLMRLISLGFYHLPKEEPLWPLSGSTLRGRLTKVLERLYLPTNPGSIPKGLTLASFRAGGATWLISKSESIELTRRRGRWVSIKVLETYLQEVSASTYMNEVAEEAKQRTIFAMSVFPELLEAAERFSRSKLPSATWFLLFMKAFGQRQ